MISEVTVVSLAILMEGVGLEFCLGEFSIILGTNLLDFFVAVDFIVVLWMVDSDSSSLQIYAVFGFSLALAKDTLMSGLFDFPTGIAAMRLEHQCLSLKILQHLSSQRDHAARNLQSCYLLRR